MTRSASCPWRKPSSDTHQARRHRAAVGITEQTDAIAIVVSEETGIISMARNGRIVRHLDERRLGCADAGPPAPPEQQSARVVPLAQQPFEPQSRS